MKPILFNKEGKLERPTKNMIYTITLIHKETGREISRDYDLNKTHEEILKSYEQYETPNNIIQDAIFEMKKTLEDNQDKF